MEPFIGSPCTRLPANSRRIETLGLMQLTPVHTPVSAYVLEQDAPNTNTDDNTEGALHTMFDPIETQNEDELSKTLTCNCSKNGCSKLYCECFARGGYCGQGCKCANCINTAANEPQLVLLRKSILRRNDHAFKRKRTEHKGRSQHRQGCSCKQSKCERGYCECFQVCLPCICPSISVSFILIPSFMCS